ncbi:pentatricopeptide repeat protein [Penicillium brasilianum]|uniref:Pentatricopeptide repeat protein n=1 Tax=Penicillium brasilianum TaxID=104259 RepID=A0A1S9RUY3_PENBI|nr:pentatricopeptide repeat protein [Penicillium brasilianum]
MFANAANSTPAVPSRNALRVLRQLAFAGSTVGSFCGVAVITYDVHRRVRVAEQIIENKRTLHTSAPNYDATASAQRLAVMMEAAEAGEFMGLASLKSKKGTLSGDKEEAPRQPNANDVKSSAQHGARHTPKWFQPVPSNASIRPISDRPTEMRLRAENRVALAREAREADAARAAGEVPLEDRIRELIQGDREIEAAQIFMDNAPATQGVTISMDRRDLMRRLFAANCIKGNIFIARSLFRHMEKWSELDSEIWATMMHLLAKEGHVESVGAIYEKHHSKLTVPPHLLEVIIRSLLESRRLTLAKRLFYARIKHDENGGLCGAYLDGLWRKTRKIELLKTEFNKILAALAELDRGPTEKVFNPMVKAYIEAGAFEAAEVLAMAMPSEFNVQPGCRTLGLVLYGKALQCDWEGVMSGLREMHELGFTNDKRSFAVVFDRVFLEYYPTHTGPQIFDFLMTCINEFKIRPDKILHRHILEAIVERCDSSCVRAITEMAEERKWNSGVEQYELVRILEARRVSMQDTPVGIWRMLQAAKQQYGSVASNRRLMGSEADNFSLRDHVLQPIHNDADKTFPESMKNLVNSRSMNTHMSLAKRQEHHIHAGNFTKAISAYRQASKSGHPIKPIHIQLVVISILLDGGLAGLKDAQKLIKSEWPYWSRIPKTQFTTRFPRFVPIFFQQILQVDHAQTSESTLLHMALFEFYKICEDAPMFNVKHHLSVTMARRLIVKDQSETAIGVLTAVYMSKWRRSHGFDQVQLKILMRAYAMTGHIRGVWWCMMTALSRQEPVLDDFLVEVKRLMPLLEKQYSQHDPQSQVGRNMKKLDFIRERLEDKAAGRPYWKAQQISVCPEKKKRRRALLPSETGRLYSRLPSAPISKMVQTFDEEIEMDFLQNRTQVDFYTLQSAWDENRMVTECLVQPEEAEYPANVSKGKSATA